MPPASEVSFDDLIPKGGSAPGGSPAGGKGMFDDLIPEGPRGATHAQLESPIADLARSVPRGLAKGAAGFVGWLTGEEALQDPEHVVSTIEKDVGGALPKPTGKAGKFGETVGEFLGSPASYLGPGGIAAKTATTVTSALGSEAAGQAAQGTGYEGLARMGGALGGGMIPQGAVRTAESAIRQRPEPPTLHQHERVAHAQYDQVDNYGVQLHPQPVSNLSDGIVAHLRSEGYRDFAGTEPATFAAVRELAEPLAEGRTATMQDFNATRRVLTNIIVNNPGKTEAAAATRALNAMETYLSRLDQNPTHVAANAQNVPAMLQTNAEARGNWRAAKRLEEVEEREYKATNQAAVSGTGANVENTVRQQFKSLINNRKERERLSPQELEIAERVARGDYVGNLARFVGKFAPHGPVTWLAALASYSTLGPAGLIIPAIGAAGKQTGEAMTQRNVRRLEEHLRENSPLGRDRAAARGPAPPPWNERLGMSPPAWTALRSGGSELSTQGP